MLRSVDGGRHWTEVSWSGTLRPLMLAFDHTSAGVAVGDAGHVWSTSDGGARWTDHGGSTSTWTNVAIADREIVLLDALGHMVRSHDGGFERNEVVVDRTARLEQRDDEIIVHTDSADYVVRRGRSTRRSPL